MFGFAAMATLVLLALPALASDPLDGIRIEPEFTGKPCERAKNFGSWIDADRDGENTREEVLIAESLVPAIRDSKGKVVVGLWVGPYAGFVTRNPSSLDIDHMVPLCEAYESGAHAWEKARRKEFGNSLTAEHHLIATWKSTNRSKNKRDPADWLPPNRAYWCTCLTDWIAIKREWGLTMDQVEADAIRKGLYVCGAYGKSDHIAGRHK